MAKQRTVRVGGFAAQNSGAVTDCYSIVRLRTPKDGTGGFVFEDAGEIAHSFYSGNLRRTPGGFTSAGAGAPELSYFWHKEKEDSKKLEKLRDKALGKRFDDIKNKEDAGELGFDVEEIWEYIGGSQVLRFIPENWLFDVTESPLYTRYIKGNSRVKNAGGGTTVLERIGAETDVEAEVTLVRTADELRDIARKINEGDRQLSAAYIRLENDIDLGGKEWAPIGGELAKAFTGLFDGAGHKVRNFKVKAKEVKAKGFFGYLRGEVYNLTVDCCVKGKGGTVAGGIAAYNVEGVIGYCASIIDIKCRDGSFGSLVGSNTGKIFLSYAAGRIGAIIIPWPLFLLPLLLLLLLKPNNSIPIFAPVPPDPGIERFEPQNPRTGNNFVSFQFEREIEADLSTGECTFNFRNPGYSNHNIVVQLQFTDADAVRIMGSTGRLAEEQAKLDANPLYDPENYRTVIAESGAIPPGYRLANLRLMNQPNGAKIPTGEYDAIVFLLFYDLNTNNRAMLETQLPVKIIFN